MIPILQQTTMDFDSWKRQFDALVAMKEWDDDKALNSLPAFVSEDILVFAKWDGKATLKSALEKLRKAWLDLNRPQDPFDHFNKVPFNSNLHTLAREISFAGNFIKASDETVIRKFISLLPESLKMAAHQFSPDLTVALQDLADHLSKLPVPRSFGVASVDTNFSESTFQVTPVCRQSKYSNFNKSKQHRSSFSFTDSRSPRRNKYICFNCGLENHFSKTCLAPPSQCTICNGRHMSSLCEYVHSFRGSTKNE